MINYYAGILLLLFAGHALADFPLQGDYLSKGKNHKMALVGTPWFWCLWAHALIHAGMVFLITRSVAFGLIELIAHMLIDYGKCEGHLDYTEDQLLHYSCKVVYWLLIVLVPGV